MMKKIIFFSACIIILGGFAACQKNDVSNTVNSAAEVAETGMTHDITEKNNSVIFVKPGDILKVTLFQDSGASVQWNFRDPVQGGFISLKDHSVITQNDQRLKEGQSISEWRMKVLKTGEFPLRFHEENYLKQNAIENVFAVKIISGKDPKNVTAILIDAPQANDTVSKTIKLMGFAKSSDGKVYYRLKNLNNEIVKQGEAKTSFTSPQYGYFETTIGVSKNASHGVLEVFLLASDGKESSNTAIPLIFQ